MISISCGPQSRQNDATEAALGSHFHSQGLEFVKDNFLIF